MRVLVTGGAGYVGSVVTEELLRDGHEVVVYDDLSKGHRAAVIPGSAFVKADLLDRDKLRDVMTKHRIESVMHMAAVALVGESVQHPREYYRQNVEAGLSLLNAMCDVGVRHIVFSSTAAVYGEPEKQPIEESDPTGPTNPYGETKLAFEHALDWYSVAYGVRYTSLRYFNAAGATEHCGEAHDPETHLIPSVLQAAAAHRPEVEVFGADYSTRDGTCIRDYIHVVDLARAHILALHAQDNSNHIYNLGSGGSGYSVHEVINVARRVTGKRIPIRISGRRTGDPAILIASSEKIRHELGWEPAYQNLERIVESAWVWMQDHPDGYRTDG